MLEECKYLQQQNKYWYASRKTFQLHRIKGGDSVFTFEDGDRRSVCMCVDANRGLLARRTGPDCLSFGGSTHYQRVGRLITGRQQEERVVGRPERITVSAAPCIAAVIVSSFQLLGHERGKAVPLNRKTQSESGYVTIVARNWVAGNLHRIGG